MIIAGLIVLGLLSLLFIWQAHWLFGKTESEGKRGTAVLVMIVGALSVLVIAEALWNEVRPERSAFICFGEKAVENLRAVEIRCVPYTETEREATRTAIADEVLRESGY